MADIRARGDLTKSFRVDQKTLSIYGVNLRPLDLDEVRTQSLASRPSVVSVDD
jgi:hypothetical protein